MACKNKTTDWSPARFDRWWPADWPFPPTAPPVGAIASRAEVKAELARFYAKFSREQRHAILEQGEVRVNTPAHVVYGTYYVALGVIAVYTFWRLSEVAEAPAEHPAQGVGEDTDEEGEENGEENGGSDTSTGYWDEGDYCDSPFLLC